jgi:hypothetical protein
MDSKRHTDRDLSKTSPSQLALLMGLDETQSLWSEDDNAAMIRHLMDSPIPDISSSCAAAQTFGHLFAAHHPDVEHLRRVKEFAKSCRSNPQSGLPEDIATVLYYAAIAAARLRCGHAISQLSVAELRDGINWALARNWLPDPIKHLFQAAARKLSPQPGD